MSGHVQFQFSGIGEFLVALGAWRGRGVILLRVCYELALRGKYSLAVLFSAVIFFFFALVRFLVSLELTGIIKFRCAHCGGVGIHIIARVRFAPCVHAHVPL